MRLMTIHYSVVHIICVVQVLAFQVCINSDVALSRFLKTLLTLYKVANHSSSEASESSEATSFNQNTNSL